MLVLIKRRSQPRSLNSPLSIWALLPDSCKEPGFWLQDVSRFSGDTRVYMAAKLKQRYSDGKPVVLDKGSHMKIGTASQPLLREILLYQMMNLLTLSCLIWHCLIKGVYVKNQMPGEGRGVSIDSGVSYGMNSCCILPLLVLLCEKCSLTQGYWYLIKALAKM